MTVSLLVVDDEPDVPTLFRQRFRREAKEGAYALHFANSGLEALDPLAAEIQPKPIDFDPLKQQLRQLSRAS